MDVTDSKPQSQRAPRRYGLTLLRVAVGLLLLATALGKTLDLSGFAAVVGTYQVLPEWSWYPMGAGLTVVEWVIGVWLLSGRNIARAGLAAAGLHLTFTGWAALALARGIDVPNCGCFGVFYARPLTVSTLYEDGVMLALCLMIYGLARRHQTTAQVNNAPGPSSGGAAKL